jgi:hypothetical protein
MLVKKSSKKLHEDIKINSNNSTIKGKLRKKKIFLYVFPDV